MHGIDKSTSVGGICHLRRCASMMVDSPQTSSLSSACGARRRTFSHPGTAAATPFLKSAPMTTACSEHVGNPVHTVTMFKAGCIELTE